jgi:hypothetical protein
LSLPLSRQGPIRPLHPMLVGKGWTTESKRLLKRGLGHVVRLKVVDLTLEKFGQPEPGAVDSALDRTEGRPANGCSVLIGERDPPQLPASAPHAGWATASPMLFASPHSRGATVDRVPFSGARHRSLWNRLLPFCCFGTEKIAQDRSARKGWWTPSKLEQGWIGEHRPLSPTRMRLLEPA